MIKLSNNTQLYHYLLSLAKRLEGTAAAPLEPQLRFAASQGTSLSTEFLGESLIALRMVLKEEGGVLESNERDDLLSVIRQVAFVLKR